ncbi:hypothetical protein [Paenibacillus marchantiophytorum]|uniref:hypothetical protein n=1 Tax=Paenibacillus marchantiophytorum TaxID=1619310 RepID=UPI00166461DB|nr:hypothetical protein [Paenibacillus marchantiophytorum]
MQTLSSHNLTKKLSDAVAVNHDIPSRLDFRSSIMKASGLHIAGELSYPFEPVVLSDEDGEFIFISSHTPRLEKHVICLGMKTSKFMML